MEDRYGYDNKIYAEGGPPAAKKDSDLATASMVLGIAGIVLSCSCCLGMAASSLALILGLISKTEPEFEKNAKTGVAAGAAGLALSFAFLFLWTLIFLAQP